MKKKHHSAVILAAADLASLWKDQPRQGNTLHPAGFDLDRVVGELDNAAQIKQMARWAAAADDVEDLVVEESLASFVVSRVSAATSFQHFAYCGALGELADGPTVIKQYEGYCWDCDPYLKWYEEVANISIADVEFNPACGVFDEEFYRKSPAHGRVSGEQDWDDQVYPSALDMAEFYGEQAQHLKPSRAGWSLQSLCFGIHMLQDMAVPQHVMCTIELEHAEYERDMYDLWKMLYAGRSRRRKDDALLNQLAPIVKHHLEGALAHAGSMREIGEVAVDMTCERQLQGRISAPERSKREARLMTAQAIACTLKAVEIY